MTLQGGFEQPVVQLLRQLLQPPAQPPCARVVTDALEPGPLLPQPAPHLNNFPRSSEPTRTLAIRLYCTRGSTRAALRLAHDCANCPIMQQLSKVGRLAA